MRWVSRVTHHAISQYRARVLHCCQRKRSDAMILAAILDQVRTLPWFVIGGDAAGCSFGGHTFVIRDRVIITVLAWDMPPKRKQKDRIARIRQRKRELGRERRLLARESREEMST